MHKMTRISLHSIILLLCFSSAVMAIIPTLDEIESSIVKVLGNTPNAASFAQFARTYGKKYMSIQETKQRFAIFSENLELIKSTNRKNLSYTLEVNEFVDWSFEEIKQRRLGLEVPSDFKVNFNGNYTLNDEVLPITKDWRAEGIVSPVRNQGNCKSCWAFSANAALEAAFHQAFKSDIDLSEQQLIDCSRSFGNNGCNKGTMDRAFQYAISAGGVATEQSYPYTASEGSCQSSRAIIGLKVKEFVNIAHGDEATLQHAVAFVRPVSVGFTALKEFYFYKGGIYSPISCGSTLADMNHALLLVGYGVEDGVPYWIAKNSWGVQWGEGGYAKILIGKNMCGIATYATYPVLEYILVSRTFL